MSDHSSHSQDRKQARALLVLGLRSLSDALWKNESITDDEIGLQSLRAGAQSVREVVREVAEAFWNEQSEQPPVPLDERRKELLDRIGLLWRGDWSGTAFDGRDGQRWLAAATHGDAAALDDLAEELTVLERST